MRPKPSAGPFHWLRRNALATVDLVTAGHELEFFGTDLHRPWTLFLTAIHLHEHLATGPRTPGRARWFRREPEGARGRTGAGPVGELMARCHHLGYLGRKILVPFPP